ALKQEALLKNKLRLSKYRAEHPTWVAERSKVFREKLKKDPAKLAAYRAKMGLLKKKYYRNNTEKFREYFRQEHVAIKQNLSRRIRHALGKNRKICSSSEYTGCSIPELKRHLENLFQPGMTWENRGEWEIDHIRPCASFDLIDPEQQRCCFHYSNLQPLWRAQNRQKHDQCR
ncbi:MAG TPA: hypothetical protein VHS96_13345, partial [Bacteroidia bacterium]|nr:hypothetical protein [Bacteroidia bacterium]